jgi:hypothetical protein
VYGVEVVDALRVATVLRAPMVYEAATTLDWFADPIRA